jgi:hypothetical protein
LPKIHQISDGYDTSSKRIKRGLWQRYEACRKASSGG